MKHKSYVLVLTSGGIDSTACIEFYQQLNFNVEAFFVDYGQPSLNKEYKSVRLISDHYKIKVRSVKVCNDMKFDQGLIIGRNALFYFLALMNFTKSSGTIASGIHEGTPYYDCSDHFLKSIEKVFDGYRAGTVKVAAPFLKFTKSEIIDYCVSKKVRLDLTYSCELGKKQPCGHCDTCKDLETIYASKK